ncbi:MAG: metal-sensing transcriptional repressor [Lachnospiraceae bacterium]|nr:metal-sensing transcriptional repressor [Lachnospiraceae bacterium]MEE3461827.1 metal-sensing transcriptional repressor [Lachnospiraceae bacterium]
MNTDAEAEIEEEAERSCCASSTGRKKNRDNDEKQLLIHRLNRIEGQVRGIRRMVEEDDYCVDILTQVSATSCAMNSFAKELISRHIKGCVALDIKAGNEEKVDELVKLIQKLMK